jgi:GTP-binding protein HflX
MFISKSTLTYMQKANLEEHFKIPVMDRYSIVIQILRLHATSTEAKLQVAMAEIPYIWQQMRDVEMLGGVHMKKQKFYLTDAQRNMLEKRERKLKHELQTVRQHRELLRHKRKQKNFPIIAVVGYTNCGKTSLIKALTHEEKLQPKNQLFATLDVTAHAGYLPSKLQVIYMDTVGFMSDLPTGLIECFVATLEDALGADLIIHVTDVSHESCTEQKNHVETTLASLIRNNTEQYDHIMENIITVGNKVDLVDTKSLNLPENMDLISSATGEGIQVLLEKVEARLLELTDRKKMIVKVPMGGEEMQWLYKNSAVTDSEADPENSQQMLLHVVIANSKLQQFRHHFLKPN